MLIFQRECPGHNYDLVVYIGVHSRGDGRCKKKQQGVWVLIKTIFTRISIPEGDSRCPLLKKTEQVI